MCGKINDMSNLDQAVEIFNQGGIVIFPTDTVWGIGCRLDMSKSIDRLFEIRKRPITQAVPVLVSGIDQAKKYYDNLASDVEEKLLKKYWPGGLTVIYQAKTKLVPERARGGSRTIGLRMPNHKDLLYIINNTGVPVLGPSANVHGEKTPVSFSEINPKLISEADYVVAGECGGEIASTVINCTFKPWKVIREGAVKL